MTNPAFSIKTEMFDHGARIGVAVEYEGQRRAIRVPNPFAAEMDAVWKAAHLSKRGKDGI